MFYILFASNIVKIASKRVTRGNKSDDQLSIDPRVCFCIQHGGDNSENYWTDCLTHIGVEAVPTYNFSGLLTRNGVLHHCYSIRVVAAGH